MKKLFKKKYRKSGFSLVELMVCVLILVLLSAMTIMILNTALGTYKETQYNTNSDVLLASIRTVLRTELADAKYIEVSSNEDDGFVISYVEGKTGVMCKIYNSDDGIILSKYDEPMLMVVPTDGLITEFGFDGVSADGSSLSQLNNNIDASQSITIPRITVYRVTEENEVIKYAETLNYYIGNR